MSTLGVLAGRASLRRPLVLVAVLAMVSLQGIIFSAQAQATSAPVTLSLPPPVPEGPSSSGNFDSVTGIVSGAARVVGWAFDNNARGAETVIYVYIDGMAGTGARGVSIGPARLARPDVAKVHPTAGPNHGFVGTITGLTPGPHTFYVYALNAGGSGTWTLLGSKPATVPVTRDTLPEGGVLIPGAQLTSADLRYRLTMQGDGNLVQTVTATGRALWSSRTAGNVGARLVMQPDGNAVLRTPTGRAAWWTGGAGAGSRLVLQPDANLVNYSSGNRAVWFNSTQNDRLAPGEALHAGQRIRSANGAYTLSMQSDSNLVVRNKAGAAVWSTRTLQYQGSPSAVSQGDGNFVVYLGAAVRDDVWYITAPRSRALWQTSTGGKSSGGTVVMQGDGNLVLYRDGVATWASRR